MGTRPGVSGGRAARPVSGGATLTIVLCLRHLGFLRHFSATCAILAERGHTVHIAYSASRDKQGEDILLTRLQAQCPSITAGPLPHRRGRLAGWLHGLRTFQDYLLYLTPVGIRQNYAFGGEPGRPFTRCHALRARAGFHVRPGWRAFAGTWDRWGQLPRLFRWCQRLEALVPAWRPVRTYLRKHHADLVLVSPLVDLGSPLVEVIKAAQAEGLPSGVLVASWDNLTTKGTLRVLPDRVFVWNSAQRTEAMAYHGVPHDRIVMTGAPVFDAWQGAQRHVVRPYLVYLGSSLFLAPDESSFVLDWVRWLRADAVLAPIPIVIRPHPSNQAQWTRPEIARLPGVILDPLGDPFAPAFTANYRTLLTGASAVIGANTSAFLDAAACDVPAFTLHDLRVKSAQVQTLHFFHLVRNGPVRQSFGIGEHLRHLREAVQGHDELALTRRTFVEHFLGTGDSAMRLADAIEGTMRKRHGTMPNHATLAEHAIQDGQPGESARAAEAGL